MAQKGVAGDLSLNADGELVAKKTSTSSGKKNGKLKKDREAEWSNVVSSRSSPAPGVFYQNNEMGTKKAQ